jgi:hypothetical protein
VQLSITQWFLPRSPLLVSIVLVAACSDEPSTGPSGSRARALTPARAIQQGTPTRPFYFLPPMVADPAPFTGVFDAGRVPTARVVCTGAAGGGCPVLASFTAGGASPGIKVDSEGQSYSAVWGAPSSLALGRGLYALGSTTVRYCSAEPTSGWSPSSRSSRESRRTTWG